MENALLTEDISLCHIDGLIQNTCNLNAANPQESYILCIKSLMYLLGSDFPGNHPGVPFPILIFTITTLSCGFTYTRS